MITIKDFMEVINYRIADTAEFQWQCYGYNSHWMDGHSADVNSVGCVFDTINQLVYEISACDYINDRAYRWIHPDFRDAYAAESTYKNIDDMAWDDVSYISLEEAADCLEKAAAIMTGKEYDTRIHVSVDFSDDELLQFLKLAHGMDITFNKLVELALTSEIERHNKSHIVTDSAF